MSDAPLQKSVKFYLAGDQIFAEGSPGDLMYVILEGEVEILKAAAGGSAKVLSTLGKGEFFGEMALIDDSPRSASAVAKTEAKLLGMNESVLDSYILTNPEFATKMIRNLAKRLRGANKLIEQALAGNTPRAVLDGLAEFAREKGTPTVKGLRVSVPAFADWAASHLGIPEKNIPDLVRLLVERGMIVTSALGENEVVYPQR
jgi:CRP/FNR family transcriptional regulator